MPYRLAGMRQSSDGTPRPWRRGRRHKRGVEPHAEVRGQGRPDHRSEPGHRARHRAARLSTRAARWSITGRKQEGLDAAVEALGADRASAVAGRADDAEHRAAVFAHIAERHGRLDHLVNNAGINPAYGPALEVDPAAARKILEVNVIAALEWTRDAVAAGLAALDRQPLLDLGAVARARASRSTASRRRRSSTSRSSSRTSWRPRIRVNAVAPGRHQDRLRPRALRGPRGGGRGRSTRCSGSGNPTTSPAPSPSCSPTTPAWITGQTLVIDGGGSIRPVG